MSELICIGTSDAFGAGGRRQSAYLVRFSSGTILLDCGQTTLTGLEACGLERNEVDAIVVSHFHADHFGGIPAFLLGALYSDQRKKPLRIIGPPGVEKRVIEAARALGHPLDQEPIHFAIRFDEIASDMQLDLGLAKLRSFETFHSPESHPHGVVLQADGTQIAYSGDTGWFQDLPAHVNGSNLFLCECTQTLRGYDYHLSLEELAEQRPAFDCDRIILTHLGSEMRTLSDHRGFEIADDGHIIKL